MQNFARFKRAYTFYELDAPVRIKAEEFKHTLTENCKDFVGDGDMIGNMTGLTAEGYIIVTFKQPVDPSGAGIKVRTGAFIIEHLEKLPAHMDDFSNN